MNGQVSNIQIERASRTGVMIIATINYDFYISDGDHNYLARTILGIEDREIEYANFNQIEKQTDGEWFLDGEVQLSEEKVDAMFGGEIEETQDLRIDGKKQAVDLAWEIEEA